MCVHACCIVAYALTLIQVRFDACDSFEPTDELANFRLFNIELYHTDLTARSPSVEVRSMLFIRLLDTN
jgi:hypothetical protein